MALFPAWATQHLYPDVPSVQAYYNVGGDVWQAVTAVLGDPGTDLRLLAAVPQPALIQAVHQARLASGDSLSAINHPGGADVAASKTRHGISRRNS